MAVNTVITLKGEQAVIMAETSVAITQLRVNTVVLAKLIDSSMYVVLRNGFIQQFPGCGNFTFDLGMAQQEYSSIVTDFILNR